MRWGPSRPGGPAPRTDGRDGPGPWTRYSLPQAARASGGVRRQTRRGADALWLREAAGRADAGRSPVPTCRPRTPSAAHRRPPPTSGRPGRPRWPRPREPASARARRSLRTTRSPSRRRPGKRADPAESDFPDAKHPRRRSIRRPRARAGSTGFLQREDREREHDSARRRTQRGTAFDSHVTSHDVHRTHLVRGYRSLALLVLLLRGKPRHIVLQLGWERAGPRSRPPLTGGRKAAARAACLRKRNAASRHAVLFAGANHRPARPVSSAGRSTRSPTSAAATSSASIQANRRDGANELPANTRIPRPHTSALLRERRGRMPERRVHGRDPLCGLRAAPPAAASAQARGGRTSGSGTCRRPPCPGRSRRSSRCRCRAASCVQPSSPKSRIIGNTLGIIATSPATTPRSTTIITSVITPTGREKTREQVVRGASSGSRSRAA